MAIVWDDKTKKWVDNGESGEQTMARALKQLPPEAGMLYRADPDAFWKKYRYTREPGKEGKIVPMGQGNNFLTDFLPKGGAFVGGAALAGGLLNALGGGAAGAAGASGNAAAGGTLPGIAASGGVYPGGVASGSALPGALGATGLGATAASMSGGGGGGNGFQASDLLNLIPAGLAGLGALSGGGGGGGEMGEFPGMTPEELGYIEAAKAALEQQTRLAQIYERRTNFQNPLFQAVTRLANSRLPIGAKPGQYGGDPF